MKRYGENITSKQAVDEDFVNEREKPTAVFYGGCAASYGAFPAPGKTKKVIGTFDVWSIFFGTGRDRKQQATE